MLQFEHIKVAFIYLIRPGSHVAFLPCRMQFKQKIMKQIISSSIVSIAFETAEMRRMNRALLFQNKTHICVKLGLFSGISSCGRQNFDMMKSQLSFVDCFTASRGFGQKFVELMPES